MSELFMLTDSVWLSALIWSVIGVTFLYLARTPARRSISALTRIFHNALRLTAQAFTRASEVSQCFPITAPEWILKIRQDRRRCVDTAANTIDSRLADLRRLNTCDRSESPS